MTGGRRRALRRRRPWPGDDRPAHRRSRPRDGARRPSGGIADARGDHRLAMAFAVAALAADRPSSIDGADAVAVSYPGFFDTLARLVGKDTE
jgi:hypothetical protein